MPSSTNRAPGRLQRFQDAFARALLAPADAGSTLGAAGLASQPGFAVYRNTVMKGCVDALRANFPAVARLVGEEWFGAAAAIYVRGNLPRHASLLDYGVSFPDFLAGFEPAAGLAWLPGVAQLDRYWTEAHAARDEEPADAEALAGMARMSRGRFACTVLPPHPSARWAWFDAQPVFSIWARNRAPDDRPGAGAPEPAWGAEGALIVRPRGAVAWIGLAAGACACAFLDACAAGATLEEAGTAAIQADPRADLTRLMAQLLAAGAFGRPVAPGGTQQEEPWHRPH